jgi:hypothetical protein
MDKPAHDKLEIGGWSKPPTVPAAAKGRRERASLPTHVLLLDDGINNSSKPATE